MKRRSSRSRRGRCCGIGWRSAGSITGASRASCASTRSMPDWVLEQVRERGPLGADALPAPDGVERRIPGSWVGTVPRAMLEAHFIQGRLAVTERRPDFSRAFDLVGAADRGGASRPASSSARRRERELLRIAARAHGIGTAKDLADYFRMPVRDARPRLAGTGGPGNCARFASRVGASRRTCIREPRSRRGSRRRRCSRPSTR